ncbi:MAG: acetate--CoA ligase [Phycisphaerae bacterium]|nr:acetate--CoA ligase [Phycisphaerae bacterium]NUQ45161.1 acetate--CoA ligase [Phycisphaerae bacterium]
MSDATSIKSIMSENRKFPPPPAFAAAAHIKSLDEYEAQYRRSIEDPDGFWAEVASDFHFFRKWDRVLEWNLPDAKWFVGGQTNVSYNCLDLQIERGRGDHTAILWEGEPCDATGKPTEIRRLTYRQLLDEVCRFANVLRNLGVGKGDRVTLYMPMIPELAVAMLACARIGAPHSVIFGGFTAQAIADRVIDAQSKVVVTCDGGWRRGQIVPLKANVDEATKLTDLIKTVVVFKRCGNDVAMKSGRDVWWHDLMRDVSHECRAEPLDSEHMLYLLYTSGSTGKPKGIQHTTAGYMVFTAYSAKLIFDLRPDDVFWCSADIGWVTGHSYVVYGILQNGVTTVMYEGAPNHPAWDRFWRIIERHRVTKFYTAPTAIRAFMKQGRQFPDACNLSSLKLLGTVGEPINPEAWMWYHEVIGRKSCPIVDTWWQTETGGILITPLPGVTATKPGSATRPFFGVEAAIMSKDGTVQPANSGGYLAIRKPWPAMLRGVYGDRPRYERQYWSEIPGVYFTGDSARRDEDGYFWIMGRVDDVIKVAGHRLGTAEIESALVSHPRVAEAAVVGFPDELTGEAIAAFVTLRTGNAADDGVKGELMTHVAKQIGAIARPKQIRFTESLPKTRSGKIMRRLLRELATKGSVEGDTTTLEDFSVIARLREDEA